ncbi:hypothetical protein Leryth_021573 [Lithospermum erythrorhizon]|nr:hypothetical protein Leryth_021573 [Lithospermum erythrorhizon]
MKLLLHKSRNQLNMNKCSSKLATLVLLMLGASCIPLFPKVMADIPQPSCGNPCTPVTQPVGRFCNTGCRCLTVPEINYGLCVPYALLSNGDNDHSTQCHHHADCSSKHGSVFCLRFAGSQYGFCSSIRYIKF